MSTINTPLMTILDRFNNNPKFQLEAIKHRMSITKGLYSTSAPGTKKEGHLMELQELIDLFSHIHRGGSVDSFYIDTEDF